MATIFTIGHSNRALSEFLQKLKENDVNVLVDIRTTPRSRFCPQYNENAIRDSLTKEGIEYRYRGKNLGGKGENINYEETIDELVVLANYGERISVMCSEGDFKACHRFSDLTPSFESRGVEVKHILYN